MRSYVWRREGIVAGLDHVVFDGTDDGIVVEGTEVAVDEDDLWVARFTVLLDRRWHTRAAIVDVTGDRAGRQTLRLGADGSGGWTIDGAPAPTFDGCLDVDISATPGTNTFAIRRADLAVGGSVDLHAAWVGVPGLEVEPLRQRYTRLEPEATFARYEYRDDRFGAWILDVDEDGVVVDYHGFARRIAPKPSTSTSS